jgi:hypothetical protein
MTTGTRRERPSLDGRRGGKGRIIRGVVKSVG